MFETSFSHKSSTPIPPTVSITAALQLLHDFEAVNRLNPDVRGQKPIQPKNGSHKSNSLPNGNTSHGALGPVQYYEVEDDLPFIPKKLWSGGVKYQADFIPFSEGCDITIHAPGGFTSVNHWRLVHQEERVVDPNLDYGATAHSEVHESNELGQVRSRNELYATGGQWYVEIVSDATCSRTFSGFVKGFLKNSHVQLQHAFVDRASEATKVNGDAPARPRRPTIGRRNSSRF